MPDLGRLTWLFFGYSGRLGRQSYALGGLLLYLARLFPVYRIIIAPDEETQAFWGGMFIIVLGVVLVAHLAMTAKRLHDIDRSGWFCVFFLIGDIIMFIFLCLVPGTQGPNRYGSRPDAPR